MYLPYSHQYAPGYLAWRRPEFRDVLRRPLRPAAAGQGRRGVLQPGAVPRRRVPTSRPTSSGWRTCCRSPRPSAGRWRPSTGPGSSTAIYPGAARPAGRRRGRGIPRQRPGLRRRGLPLPDQPRPGSERRRADPAIADRAGAPGPGRGLGRRSGGRRARRVRCPAPQRRLRASRDAGRSSLAGSLLGRQGRPGQRRHAGCRRRGGARGRPGGRDRGHHRPPGRRRRRAAAQLRTLGSGRPSTVQADVSDVGQAQDSVRRTVERFGRVDGLVNAAGLTSRGTLLDTTPELFDAHIAINLRAPFFLMQAAVRRHADPRRARHDRQHRHDVRARRPAVPRARMLRPRPGSWA